MDCARSKLLKGILERFRYRDYLDFVLAVGKCVLNHSRLADLACPARYIIGATDATRGRCDDPLLTANRLDLSAIDRCLIYLGCDRDALVWCRLS